MKRILVLVAMAGPLLFGGGSAEAWIITQISPLDQSAAAVWTPMPGAGPDVERWEIDKYFLLLDGNGDPVPLVLEFKREAGDANTIEIVDELIYNLYEENQVDWVDYHVLLAVDSAAPTVSFVNPGDARAWQTLNGESRLDHTPAAWTGTSIDWVTTDPNQFVPWGTFADISATQRNQLLLSGLVIDAGNLAVDDTFRLIQVPSIPEPATATLLAAGLLGLVLRRKNRRALLKVLLPVAIVLAVSLPAGAVTISQLSPDPNSASITWSSSVVSDHVEADLEKVFKVPGMLGTPLTLEFTLDANDFDSTGAPREIWLVYRDGTGTDLGERVHNDTGLPWLDYHFVLVNVPAFFPQFADANFVIPGQTDPAIVSDVFGAPDLVDLSHIDFSGATVPSGGEVYFSNIRIRHDGDVGDVFRLKQIPTPEPATLLLLAAGALAVVRKRRN